MSETLPDHMDIEWPVNHAMCHDWESIDNDVMGHAEQMARMSLHALTAYRIGGVVVTVRPCRDQGGLPTWQVHQVSTSSGHYLPYIRDGVWYNALRCGTRCGCLGPAAIHLPGPVGRVDEVKINGVVLGPENYRHDGTLLIRTDGGVWPSTQDFIPEDGDGTFLVTYLRGIVVDGMGALAAGVLACEFAKALTGGDCALPTGVTSVVRAGISFEMPVGLFPEGMTGLPLVDSYIRFWNPYGLRTAPSVTSVDFR